MRGYLVGLLLLIALPVLGQEAGSEREYAVEFTPFAGYRFGGEFDEDNGTAAGSKNTFNIDEGSSFGLIVNLPADANTQWEIMVSRQATRLDTGDLFTPGEPALRDLDITYVQGGGTYLFDEEQRAHPYIVATIGAARLEPGDAGFDAETYFAFSIGGGYRIAPTSRIGLRLEGRVFGTIIDSDGAIFCRSDATVSGCLIRVNSNVLWQFEVLAGLTFRF